MTGASVAVLLASNDSAVAHWQLGSYKVQPQVYVSILVLLIDVLLAFALADGLMIRFWRQATHGTTVSINALKYIVENLRLFYDLKQNIYTCR